MRRLAAALLAAATLAAGCGGGGGSARPRPSGTGSGEPLPLVALDPCPALPPPGPPPRGKALPDLTLDCLGEGPAVPLRALRGTPSLVNLWASWCGPCRREMPALQRLYRRAGGRVRFLGIDTKDSERRARETVQMTAVDYPSVVDPDERVRTALRAVGLPVTVLVRADGSIATVLYGEKDEAEFVAAIREHLGVAL